MCACGIVAPDFHFIVQRDARLHKNQKHVKSNDSYNMEDMAMPLHQYINDPIALDIVHNGATFQVVHPSDKKWTYWT